MRYAGFLIALLVFSQSAFALHREEDRCDPDHDAVVERIAENYDEVPIFAAHSSRNAIVEIFVSEAGTWSTVITMGGISCLVDAGEWFELIAPKPPTKPST